MALDRTWYTSLVDDDGSGTTGTIIDKAAIDHIYDDVDAALGVWASYTPTLGAITLGNGTLGAQWRNVNGVVKVDIALTIGSTTSFSAGVEWTFSLPATAANLMCVGNAFLRDIGTAYRIGVCKFSSTTTVKVFTDNVVNAVTDTTPFTWAVNDELQLSFVYRAA